MSAALRPGARPVRAVPLVDGLGTMPPPMPLGLGMVLHVSDVPAARLCADLPVTKASTQVLSPLPA